MIDLKNNDCVVYQPLDYFPSESFFQNSKEKSKLEFELIDSIDNSRTFRLTNNGAQSIYFLDSINLDGYASLPMSNNGSLWVNEKPKSNPNFACLLENNYSVTVSELNKESIITLYIYTAKELKPNEEFDITLHMEIPGKYRVLLMHSGAKLHTKSTWGLNKSHQIITEKFTFEPDI